VAHQAVPGTLIHDTAQLISRSQAVVEKLINKNKGASINQLIANTAYYFSHIAHASYLIKGATGEGDWCEARFIHHGCPHIQQDPIYRVDGFNCYTLVTFVMSLIRAHQLDEFRQHIFDIGYGANRLTSRYPANELSYRNRNHFISHSFNFINHITHRLKDVTDEGIFSDQVKSVHANIQIGAWFAMQARPDRVAHYVRVKNKLNAALMAHQLGDPNYVSAFTDRSVTIRYIPKSFFVKKMIYESGKIAYVPNNTVIEQLPTPSVVEIVREPSRWKIGRKTLRDLIGSDVSVSHMGLLYRYTFSKGETIYQKTDCYYRLLEGEKVKRCDVHPVVCQKKAGCHEVMLLEASNIYPNDYVWSYDVKQKHFYCTSLENKPSHAVSLGDCNRVIALPIGDYLTYKAYGHYSFMDSDSIVGIHIEKIL